jgi:hypothetical protein
VDKPVKKLPSDDIRGSTGDGAWDLNDLLHPAQAFSHPSEVVADPDLTLHEKRAILASWASDACAIESAALRCPPSGDGPISFDEVIDALRALDKAAAGTDSDRYRRVLRRRRIFGHDRGRGEGGQVVH